jgi:6-methylsalicylate decarboxylase
MGENSPLRYEVGAIEDWTIAAVRRAIVRGEVSAEQLKSWVPNPNGLTATELTAALSRLYLDTAATCPTSLAAALAMTTPDQLVYGSDCGVPCTSEATMDRNLAALLNFPNLTDGQKTAIGARALQLFPSAAARVADSTRSAKDI